MIARRGTLRFISSRDHFRCPRHRKYPTSCEQAFNLRRTLSSDFVECSCVVVMPLPNGATKYSVFYVNTEWPMRREFEKCMIMFNDF